MEFPDCFTKPTRKYNIMDASTRKEGGSGFSLPASVAEKSDVKSAVGVLSRSATSPFTAHSASEKEALALQFADVGSRVAPQSSMFSGAGPVTRSVGVALHSVQPSAFEHRWSDTASDHLSFAGSAKLARSTSEPVTQDAKQRIAVPMRIGKAPKSNPSRPPPVPTLPFQMSRFLLPMECSGESVHSTVQSILEKASVDFSYKADKYKAKCYVYRAHGYCHFVLHVYTKRDADNQFIVELQRRNGCCHEFRSVYDKLLLQMKELNVLSMCDEVQRKLAQLSLVNSIIPTAGEELEREAPASITDLTKDETHAAVHAVTSLLSLLKSQYDDLAGPAAQSIASLTSSRRIRSVLGVALKADSDQTDAKAVLDVFRELLLLCCNPSRSFGTRTAAAIALTHLSAHRETAAALQALHVPLGIVSGLVRFQPLSAESTALCRNMFVVATDLTHGLDLSTATVDVLKAASVSCDELQGTFSKYPTYLASARSLQESLKPVIAKALKAVSTSTTATTSTAAAAAANKTATSASGGAVLA